MGVFLETVQGEHWTPGKGHPDGSGDYEVMQPLSLHMFTMIVLSLHFLG